MKYEDVLDELTSAESAGGVTPWEWRDEMQDAVQKVTPMAARNSNLVRYAIQELHHAGMYHQGEGYQYNGMLADDVIQLIAVFASQGHSGASASYVSTLFDRLSRFRHLSPLDGGDSEWTEVGCIDRELYQNKRNSAVFKEVKNGVTEAYTLDGFVFHDLEGHSYTNGFSRKTIHFPYKYEKSIDLWPRKGVTQERIDECNDREAYLKLFTDKEHEETWDGVSGDCIVEKEEEAPNCTYWDGVSGDCIVEPLGD